MEPKKPFHEMVAEKLIEQLKAGTAPWQRPWEPGEPNSMLPMNPTTGKRYKGINAIHLMAQGRSDSRWMTYKQAAAVGAQVRKGEKGTPVQYWKFSEEQTKLDDNGKPVLDAEGKPVKKTVMLERPRVFFATVFNGEQIDGLPPIQKKEQTWAAIDRAEHILNASGADLRHGAGDRAFYRPATDSIHLPDKGQFPSADRYYATALHELGHWTGHPSRLDRDLSHPFGSEGYAKEELRAEIASMILGDELGIGHDPGQHAAYVASWIKGLQEEPLEIFRAAADAEKIHNYVLSLEQQQQQQQQQQQGKERNNELNTENLAVQALAIDIREVIGNSNVELNGFKMYVAGSLDARMKERGLDTVGAVTGHDPNKFFETAWSRLSPVFGAVSDPIDRISSSLHSECKGVAEAFSLKAKQLYQKTQQSQEQRSKDLENEAWALKHLERDTLVQVMGGATSDQIKKVSAVLSSMKPLSTTNGFWMRHELPYDVDALEGKLKKVSAFFEKHRLNTSKSEATEQQQKTERTYINVPYREKNEAKELGARWDRQRRSWYVPGDLEVGPFAKWAQGGATAATEERQAQQRTYLAVPYGERGAAKAAGAMWDKAAKSWYAGPKADMERLQRWMPDNVRSEQDPAMSPREEFAEALRSIGCVVSGEHPIMDGKKHRIGVEGDKKGEKAGFYVGHLDGHPAGYIKNNRTGIEMKWKSKGYALDPAEKAKLQAEAAAKLAARAAEQERVQKAAAQRVTRQTSELQAIEQQQPTPYLNTKGVQVHDGVMTDKEGQKTYIPAFDADGKQWTMQYIQEDGTKRFAKDSRKEGCFHPVGGMDAVAAAPALIVAEGYATAAQVAEASGQAAIAAFDSGNLEAVAKALHEKFPDKPVIIAGDDDRHLELTQGVNPGRSKAEAAAKAVGGKAIFPIFAPGENTYPANLPPITPQVFHAHERAQQRLDAAEAGKVQLTEKESADLKRALLSTEQLGGLAGIKAHTDFNDLATRSSLGRDAVNRQVSAAVARAVQAAERKVEKKQERVEKLEQQRPQRSVRVS